MLSALEWRQLQPLTFFGPVTLLPAYLSLVLGREVSMAEALEFLRRAPSLK